MATQRDRENRATIEYREARRAILGATDASQAISQLKIEKKTAYIQRVLPLLAEDSELSQSVLQTPFPKSLRELKTNHFLRSRTLEDEIVWNSCIVKLYAKEIDDFLAFENRFNTHLLFGEYRAAHEVLSAVTERFGYSLWLLNATLHLLELRDGFASQKKYSNEIVQNEGIHWMVRGLTALLSLKAESNSSPQQLRYFIDESGISKLSPTLAKYFEFHALEFEVTDQAAFRDILFYEGNSSVIDRYKTLISIYTKIVGSDRDSSLLHAIRNSVIDLVGFISDDRLATLLLRLTGQTHTKTVERGSPFLKLLDMYTEGKYQELLQSGATDSLKSSSYEYFELVASASARSSLLVQYPAGTIAEVLYKYISRFTSKISTLSSERLALGLLVRRYDFIPACRQLILGMDKSTTGYSGSGLVESVAFHLEGNIANPRRISLLRGEQQVNEFCAVLSQGAGHTSSIKLQLAVHQLDQPAIETMKANCEIPEARFLKYSAVISEYLADISAAADIYSRLSATPEALSRFEGLEGLIRCRLKQKNYTECVNLVVNEYFSSSPRVESLPLRSIFDQIKIDPPYADYGVVEFPIFFDLVWRIVDKQYKYMLRDAYEAYLAANGVTKPSELEMIKSGENTQQNVYFLRFVCIPSNMQTSIGFSGTDDLLTERIRICQYLGEMDKVNISIYNAEIKELTQTLMLNRAMTTIEKSKIFVDVDGVKASLNELGAILYSRFQRYREIARLLGDRDHTVAIVGTVPGATQQFIFSSVKEEATRALQLLLTAFRNQFVASSEYGLDSYLSINIRHGTFFGELRAPFELADLITEKDTETNKYNRNSNWEFVFQDKPSREWLVERLAVLSGQIDSIISHAKDELIQVWDAKNKPEGLFKFEYALSDVQELEARIGIDDSYQDAVSTILELLWKTTDDGLADVRSELELSVAAKMQAAIDQFRREISNSQRTIYSSRVQLNDALTSVSSNVQSSVARIANWFRLQSHIETEDYQVELPISIAEEMAKNIHPKLILDNKKDIQPDIKLKGFSLTALANVMYNIFDNVIEHGRYDAATVHADTKISRVGDRITIRVSNAVPTSRNLVELAEKIETLKLELGKETDFKISMGEGGRGIFKIRKILEVDLKSSCDYHISIEEGQYFTIQLEWGAQKWLR